MAQSVNDFWIHGCWSSVWYLSYQPEALCLASRLIEIRPVNSVSKEGQFHKVRFRHITNFLFLFVFGT